MGGTVEQGIAIHPKGREGRQPNTEREWQVIEDALSGGRGGETLKVKKDVADTMHRRQKENQTSVGKQEEGNEEERSASSKSDSLHLCFCPALSAAADM